MLLKDRSKNRHSCVYTLRFQCLKQIRQLDYLLTVTLAVIGEGITIDVKNHAIWFAKHSRRN